MTPTRAICRFIGLLSVAVLHASAPALAGDGHVQFCWAMGKFDNTMYFAEVEDREDRQASFDQLLEISGIEHHPVRCRTSQAESHRRTRAYLLQQWRSSELEVVNTTFLSDLDY